MWWYLRRDGGLPIPFYGGRRDLAWMRPAKPGI
jgi:hypothetical protein